MSKIRNGRLDQYGDKPFEQWQSGTVGIKGVNKYYSVIISLQFNMKQHIIKTCRSCGHTVNSSKVDKHWCYTCDLYLHPKHSHPASSEDSSHTDDLQIKFINSTSAFKSFLKYYKQDHYLYNCWQETLRPFQKQQMLRFWLNQTYDAQKWNSKNSTWQSRQQWQAQTHQWQTNNVDN